jgi:O-antigen/teichoic acid export membrane protein
MSRRKLFIENIFLYGFIQVLNKIVPFLLLPVITRMLPNASDYGIYNIYSTVIGFGAPLAILGITDAMYREYFEKEDQQYRYNVTTTAQRIIMISSIVVSILLLLLNKSISLLFFGESKYGNIIIFAAIGILLEANLNIIQTPTRMQNQKKTFLISGILSSLIIYGLAVLFIHFGLSYFGLIYSSIISSVLMITFFWIKNKKFFLNGLINKKILIELFKIGLPLLPTFLIYWVYNSSDKIMITNILGTYEMGIYSIGAKVAQISQLIYAGFAGGWQYFVFSTMKDSDQIELNSKVFEYLGVISILSLIIIYPIMPSVFKLFFTGDYVSGYVVAPYLYITPLLLMLFQVAGNQFIVVKKSYLSTISLGLGAIINIILNSFLIKRFGIEGAAIATLAGYSISIIVVMLISYKFKLMFYSKRIIIVLLIIPIYFFLQRIVLNIWYPLQFVNMLTIIGLILFLYKNQIKQLLQKVRRLK